MFSKYKTLELDNSHGRWQSSNDKADMHARPVPIFTKFYFKILKEFLKEFRVDTVSTNKKYRVDTVSTNKKYHVDTVSTNKKYRVDTLYCKIFKISILFINFSKC